jgi:Flp pilus assembly protein CpaB
MSLTDLPPAAAQNKKRRKSRPAQRWTPGHVLPVVLAIFAVIFVLAALRDRSAQTSVVVASRQIPAGATINAGDTRTIKMRTADADALSGLLGPAQVTGGLVAATAIGPGEPIIRTETLSGPARAAGLGSMSLPIPADQADGGAIAVGDQVDVIAGTATGANYIAQGLAVLAVSTPATTGVLAGTNTNYSITVAVDQPTALRLAAALAASSTSSGNTLEVIRSTGETPTSQQTYTNPNTAGPNRPTNPAGGNVG